MREVIENINNGGGLFTGFDFNAGTAEQPDGQGDSVLRDGTGNKWLGAQATIQRWYADPVLSNDGVDRTLRTIFTHDHFGPSTHQQVGLYAGLLVEPAASQWQDPVSGVFLGTNLGRPRRRQRSDDRRWRADELAGEHHHRPTRMTATASSRSSSRTGSSRTRRAASRTTAHRTSSTRRRDAEPAGAVWGWADPDPRRINAAVGRPAAARGTLPFPSIVTLAFQTGTYSLNYRNEPPPFRVNPSIGTPTRAADGPLAASSDRSRAPTRR